MKNASLFCPNCGEKFYCPCDADGCKKARPKNKEKWIRTDGCIEQCPKCGFAQHMDWWATLEWDIFRESDEYKKIDKKV